MATAEISSLASKQWAVAGRGQRIAWRLAAVAGTGLANAIVWLIAVPLLGIKLEFVQPNGTVVPFDIMGAVVFSVVPALLGWALLALLEWRTARARRIWTITALVVLALSFVPVPLAGFSLGMALVFSVMHLVVAAVLIPILARTSRTA